jgi:redox-sensing transcriptional repressor
MSQRDLKIPEATVQRLSVYLRYLESLEKEGQKIVSSYELASNCGFKAAQIRKDFAYFGELGVRGVGYYTTDLINDLKSILGLSSIWDVALVGAGHLGVALMAYKGFIEYGFSIGVVFDTHPEKVPEDLLTDREIHNVSRMGEVLKEKKIKIAILAVPADSAQKVTDLLVGAGVRAILNFAPVKLTTPKGVKIRDVDMAVDLGVLSFFVTGRRKT